MFRPVGTGGAYPQILADQLTLSQPEGRDYAHQITIGTPGFSNLPTAPEFMLVVYAGNAARAAVQLIFVCSQNEQNLAKAVI